MEYQKRISTELRRRNFLHRYLRTAKRLLCEGLAINRVIELLYVAAVELLE